MSSTSFPPTATLGIAEQAFRGLPRPARSRPAPDYAQTLRYRLQVEGALNAPMELELHQQQDGQWFWEYRENRFGQAKYAGVFDGYALWPKPARTYPSVDVARAALLEEVLTTFPMRPGTLTQQACAH